MYMSSSNVDNPTDDFGQRGLRPVPDPTVLTTEQLHREIAALREFVLGEIRHVGEMNIEKFTAVGAQFESVNDKFRDVAMRTAEQKTDTKDALDAALQAAKDAVSLQTEASDKAIAKSEAATTKQIDALAVLVDKSADATTEKIVDLKSRLDKLESALQARSQGIGLSMNAMVIAASLIISAIGLVIAFGR